MGDGGEATDLADSSFPVAFRTYLMVADPGVTGCLDGATVFWVAVTTRVTFCSILRATPTTAVVIRYPCGPAITADMVTSPPVPLPSAANTSSFNLSSAYATLSIVSASRSRWIRSTSADDCFLVGTSSKS